MELIVLGGWALCGLFSAMIAGSKGRSGCGWFVLGLLLGPLGLLGAAVISPDHEQNTRAGLQNRTMRNCPYCTGVVPVQAVKCMHCASDLPPPPQYDALGRQIG